MTIYVVTCTRSFNQSQGLKKKKTPSRFHWIRVCCSAKEKKREKKIFERRRLCHKSINANDRPTGKGVSSPPVESSEE